MQDNSYMKDRGQTPALVDMAKPETKLADMVKHDSKPAAEANGGGAGAAAAHVKAEPAAEAAAAPVAQQARGHDEAFIAGLGGKPPGPSTHSNIAPPPVAQGAAAGIAPQPPQPR